MLKTLAPLICALGLTAAAPAPSPVAIPVTVDPALGAHQSGRLIIFAKPLADPNKPDASVNFSDFTPSAASIAAREVSDLTPGRAALVDGDTDSFPAPFSTLAPGTYEVQAVLDRNHDYAYSGRGAGDLVSKVVTVTLPGAMPTLVLSREVPAPSASELADSAASNVPDSYHDAVLAYLPRLKAVAYQSPTLTAFRGTPTYLRGWVALPPGYDGKVKFPTVYTTGGFGSSLLSAKGKAAAMMADMAKGKAPPMIWIFLDHSSGTGLHEFADSVNNGPWGTALATELIPALERQYAMDARPSGRFLTGHSSGGWSSLWLQVRYPRVFGGAWPTSPDPSDFHAFLAADLYAPDANLYHDAAGKPSAFFRVQGKPLATIEEFTRAERAIGPYGGQMTSFDWVFSPRGTDGRPLPLIDASTGRIDPAVAAYWRDHYDIAHILQRDWKTLRPDLDGKIHITVGADDTFYLDAPAHRLEAVMKALRAKTDFRFLPGKTHFDLYERGAEPLGLLQDIAWEMYAIARPGSKRPSAVASPAR